MKKYLAVVIVLILCLMVGCIKKESGITENDLENEKKLETIPFITSMFVPPLEKKSTMGDILSLVKGRLYYLDAISGNDLNGDGTAEKPWKSLVKVQAVLKSGDGVILRSGNYGAFTKKSAYTIPTLYIAEEGEIPIFTQIRLRDNDAPFHTAGDPETATKANLVFYGISIRPQYVDPGTADPMDPQSTQSTYNKCSIGIDLKWFGSIKFINCYLSPDDKYGESKKFLSLDGISLNCAPDVWIEGCDIDSFNSGINYSLSPRLRIYYNKIHGVAGGMISNKDAKSIDTVIEGNHLYDSNWAVTDKYCPRKSVAVHYHGSFVSLRGANVVVRNNIMHYGCNSSGMMLYDDCKVPFDNILIEGNQIYDPNNFYALRMYNVNSNVIVRNNTLINRGRYGSSDEWKYGTAFAVHSFYGEKSGTRLFIYNNAIVGRLGIEQGAENIAAEGNIVYSCNIQLPETNIVAYSLSNSMFENGFFSGELDVTWQNWENNGAGYENPRGHGKILNLTPAANSPALNYGISLYQPETKISGLDSQNFLELSERRVVQSAGSM